MLDALSRVLDSGALGKGSRHPALLRYVVAEELAGRGAALKAYAIGVDALGRPSDFDPNTDSIVRVEFRRLRQALENYYLKAGRDDPVRIGLPSGGYRPAFTRSLPPSGGTPLPGAEAQVTSAAPPRFSPWTLAALAVLVSLAASLWQLTERARLPLNERQQAVTVVVRPVGHDPDPGPLAALSTGLGDELASALSRIKAFRVTRDATPQPGFEDPLAFHVSLGLQQGLGGYRLVANLTDEEGRLFWGSYFAQAEQDLPAVQAAFVRQLVQELRPQIFKAAKREIAIGAGLPEDAWNLYVGSTWVPGDAVNSLDWEKQRVAMARRALKLAPLFGQAHSVLADKLAYLANTDSASDTAESRREAEAHAETAIETAGDDPDALFNASLAYWHLGDLPRAEALLGRTLELDPNHVLAGFLKPAVPYTCEVPPADVAGAARRFDAALAPDNPVRWVTLTWISLLAMNAGHWDEAEAASRHAALIFRTPDTVLRFAAILVHQGKADEARRVVDQQRQSWPGLDPAHYADVTMARRCRSSLRRDAAVEPYRMLAKVLAESRTSSAP